MHHKSIPANDFAVVKDIERNIIVYSGTFSECVSQADSLNHAYQSRAYVAQGWNH